ncbi:MAG: TrmB family transcriptional regulator [Candidatus Altiarchaeota archaeon]|nr:TrmB family transcriptional regulator [Candidatus Altiarchaeota archaeon]
MIVPKRLVDRARHFMGTNLYETRLWLALLNHGISTAGELAEAAGVPRSRSYDVLESLSQKGLVIIKAEGRPLKYAAVPPDQAVSNINKFYEMTAEERKDNLTNLKSSKINGQLKEIYKKGEQVMDMSEITGLVRGKNNVFSQLATLLARSMDTAKIMLTGTDVVEINKFYLDAFKDAKGRGSEVKVLVPKNSEVGELSKYANVKQTEHPMTRGMIVDSKEAMLMFMDPDEVHHSFDAGVCVASPHIARTMDNLFEGVWKSE